ncbi:MAG TPA: DUF1329 domain-containing protein [Candidatus Kryptonia bacterium]|nr:DUF1329 domain-containing protein [Candidatus Kryptonia bacterium]
MFNVARLAASIGLVFLLAGGASGQSAPASGGLKPGEVLTPANAKLASGLLPPEILRHYETGEYVNTPIVDWPNGIFKFDSEFLAASESNAGKYKIDANGTVVDAQTGLQPPVIIGFPFPNIDPADPKAGAEVLWNYVYGGWYIFGSIHSTVELNWIKPSGLDRQTSQDVNFLYYDGQPQRYRQPNPQNFSMQFLTTAMTPTDLNGTTSLTWRYRDPTKRDSNWVYVPALRRVRAVSPANRSDGFLGSDMSQDDGPFFDGKPEDFNWKLVGERDQYRYVDPLSLAGKSNIIWLPHGGWRAIWPKDVKTFGYEDPTFTGIGWAPIAPALAKRPFWVIEATPKDKYYLYGRIELYIDKESYEGAWNRKFSWTGELLNTLQVMTSLRHKYTRPDGTVEYLIGSNMGYRVAENVKMNRATTAGTLAPLKEPASDTRIPIDPAFFEMSTLSRFGK